MVASVVKRMASRGLKAQEFKPTPPQLVQQLLFPRNHLRQLVQQQLHVQQWLVCAEVPGAAQ